MSQVRRPVPGTPRKTNPYRSGQIRILVATWLAYAGYYFGRKAFYVVKADLAQDLGLTTIDLAHLGTAYLLAYMFGQFSSAFFGRRLGPKVLLLVGIGVSIACNMVFGISNGYATVMLFLAVNGLAQGTGWPGSIGSLAFWFKRRQRGSILGVWATCYQVGSVVASALAAYILGVAGWRWSFFGASSVMLVVWFIVLFVHPNRPRDLGLDPIVDDDEEGDEPAPEAGEGANEKGLAALGWTRQVVITILMMGFIYFCIKFLRYALWSWAPFFLRRNFGMAGDDAGYVSVVFDIAGFAGVLFAGFASDRLFKGRRAALSFTMLLGMAVSFVLMYHYGATSVVLFAASMGAAGFMLYGPDSLLSGVGAIDVGSRKGALAAAGIINGMGSAGPVFQEEIVGWMYKAYHQALEPILLMLVGVACLGAALTFVLWMRARRGVSRI